MEDVKIKRGKYEVCKKKLMAMGLAEQDAVIICGQQLLGDDGSQEDRSDPPSSQLLTMLDTEELDDGKDCISRKISIFANEHPEWAHDKVVAAAHSYCKSKKHDIKDIRDAIEKQKPTREIGRSVGISMRKFSTLIKLIKSKKSLKIGHAGLLPFKVELPQKNLNKLQTKLERLITEEAGYLTAEQLAQRSQYATYIKKRDTDEDFIRELEEEIQIILEINSDLTPEQLEDSIIRYLTPYELRHRVWVDNTIEFGKANMGMNNIIKAPITLAKEMIQEYRFINDDGSIRVEKHFKDYNELKQAIIGLNRLYMIVEHNDSWNLLDTVGCVRQIVADDKTRSIRGMGYFKVNALPAVVLDALQQEIPFGVSIGFLAELGGPGEFNGQLYDFIQKHIQLDHLAICVDSQPRCPIESCGVNVEGEIITDNTEFTIINKEDYYYNINNIILDSKETIELDNQEEILGEIMQKDGFKDPSSGQVATDEPELFEEVLGKLRKWLAGVTDPDVKSSLKDQIIKLFGDKIEMEQKELDDALALKDKEVESMKNMLKKILKRDIKSFTDKYSDADLDGMSLEKLEVVSEVVSDPKIRVEKKVEVLPMTGTDTEDKKQKEKPERVDPKSIFLDTNKEFVLDSFIASNFGEERK